MNAATDAPNDSTPPDTENKIYVRQLLDGQEYSVAKGDIIENVFGRKAAVEWCVAYLHGFYWLPGCPTYTGYIITSGTCLQLLHIDNNTMFGAAQLMADLRGGNFNTNKALYINFQNHATFFCK